MQKHLTAITSPRAHKDNIVYFSDYRITVLGERLFRIERENGHGFNDCATQHIWFRNMPPQSFTAEAKEDRVSVFTASATLIVDRDFENSRVILDGRELPLGNSDNLMGTYRTLDCYDGEFYIRDHSKLKLETGVCSKNGVAVVDDTGALILNEDGRLLVSIDHNENV